MYDCHIHSSFSGDSEMKPETACETSIDLGLKGIAFTDHLDYDYPDFDEFSMIDFKEYSKYIDSLKNLYSGRINIYKGIEVGFQPHVMAESNDVINSHNFDFVISSVHIIDGLDPYVDKYFIGKTKYEAYSRYLKEIFRCVTEFKNYDVVGHIGYLRRYGSYDDRTLRYTDFSDVLDSILKVVINDGKGLEINSSGYKYDYLASPIPDYDILKRYRELGGEIIVTGSDAHTEEYIAYNFKTVYKKLHEIGFKYTAHYEQRKPIFDRIE